MIHLTIVLHLFPGGPAKHHKVEFPKKEKQISVVHSSFTYSICIYYTWSRMSTSFCVAIILLLFCRMHKQKRRAKKTCRSKRHIRRHTHERARSFLLVYRESGFAFSVKHCNRYIQWTNERTWRRIHTHAEKHRRCLFDMSFLYTTNGKYERRIKSIKFNFFVFRWFCCCRFFLEMLLNWHSIFSMFLPQFFIAMIVIIICIFPIHPLQCFETLCACSWTLRDENARSKSENTHTKGESEIKEKKCLNPINEKLWLSRSWSYSCAMHAFFIVCLPLRLFISPIAWYGSIGLRVE